MDALFEGRGVLSAVEDDEDARVEADPEEVGVQLAETFGEGILSTVAPDLELERLALRVSFPCGVLVGPAHEEIDAATAEAVLPGDVPPPLTTRWRKAMKTSWAPAFG